MKICLFLETVCTLSVSLCLSSYFVLSTFPLFPIWFSFFSYFLAFFGKYCICNFIFSFFFPLLVDKWHALCIEAYLHTLNSTDFKCIIWLFWKYTCIIYNPSINRTFPERSLVPFSVSANHHLKKHLSSDCYQNKLVLSVKELYIGQVYSIFSFILVFFHST